MRQIPLSVPNLSTDIVDNLRECIETGWVSTGGRFITEFEQKLARYVGMQDAVSVQSGTAGLHLALKVLGVGPGDEVIVPTLTFIAAVNPLTYLGASPVFMDCDDSLCLDLNKTENFLKEYSIKGRKIKAIIPVHIFGNMCDMHRLMKLAKEYEIPVIEDATEALGSYFTQGPDQNKFAGTMGDIGVYSFNANKIITTGGGGMVVSRHKEYLDRIRYLSLTAKNDSLYFVHDEAGFNYRMLNIQAALGVSQIDQLEAFIKVKSENYEQYRTFFVHTYPDSALKLLPFCEGQRSNHWFYSVLIDAKRAGVSRDTLMHRLIECGIQCRPIWKLIHTQKPYEQYETYKIEKALFYEKNILNIPCSTSLDSDDIRYICGEIQKNVGESNETNP